MELTKAFGYLRVSSNGQVDGDGFTRQKVAIEAYAAANGLQVVEWFEESGVSGTKDLADRPALQEMLLALLSNGVRTVLTEKLDRLARDLMIQEAIINDLQKRGMTLVSVMEPDLCTTDPSRKLIRQIMGAIAEYDRTMIVLKTRAARQRIKAATGKCEGKKSYGHYANESDNLKRINELRTAGANFERIAATLNEEGRKTRTGGEWFGSTVNRICKAQAIQTVTIPQ